MKHYLRDSMRGILVLVLLSTSMNFLFANHAPSSSFSQTDHVGLPFIISNTVLPTTNNCEIYEQPNPVTVCENSNATFVATGTGASFHWEISSDGNNFQPIDEEDDNFSQTNMTHLDIQSVNNYNNHHFRLVATGSGCSAVSDAVSLTVNPQPQGYSDFFETCSGKPFSIDFQTMISNNVPSDFAWEVLYVPSDVTGLTQNQQGTGNLDVVLHNESDYYYYDYVYLYVYPTAKETNCAGNGFYIYLSVHPNPTKNLAISGATEVCTNNQYEFSIPYRDGVTYQWQVQNGGVIYPTDNDNKVNIEWAAGTTGDQLITLDMTTWEGCNYQKTLTVNVESPPSIDIQANAISCHGANDGSATVLLDGTVPASDVQIHWDNGSTNHFINGLAPGNYFVRAITPNGCVVGQSTTIIEPTPLAMTAVTITDATCPTKADGAITLTTTGGTGQHYYQWFDTNGHLISNEASVANLAGGIYTLQLADESGCQIAGTYIVDDTDTQAPSLSCEDDYLSLNANGEAVIDVARMVAFASDNCGLASVTFENNQTTRTFSCADIGSHSVTIVATDNNGNSTTCEATVYVSDQISPVIECPTEVIDFYLPRSEDATDEITISIEDLGINASDNCGIQSLQFNRGTGTTATFSCSEIGINDLIITATDNGFNQTFCTVQVNIIDNAPPAIDCPTGFQQVRLDENGQGVLTVDDFNLQFKDHCGIEEIFFAGGGTRRTFDCNDVGTIQRLNIGARDVNGNSNFCNIRVVILDLIEPTIQCSDEPIYVPLDVQDAVTLTAAELATTSDNCSTPTLSFTGGFANRTLRCDNIAGMQQIEIIATDAAGNKASCFRDLDIEDRIAPTVSCNRQQLYIVSLGANGQATLQASDLIDNPLDDCAISSVEFTDGSTAKTFDCNHITQVNGGFQALTVVVRDNGVQIAACTRLVLIIDDENVCP